MVQYQVFICDAAKRACASCRKPLYVGANRASTRNKNKSKAYRISPKKRLNIYKQHGIYVQDYHNFCSNCDEKSIDSIHFEHKSEQIELPLYIITVLKEINKENKDSFRNARREKAYIYNEDISPEDHYILTGLSIEQKNILIERIDEKYDENNENASNINPQHLIIFLTLIYQGICEALAGVLFGYAKCSIGRIIQNVANVLSRLYVPTELGATAWNHQKLLNNTPHYVKTLFPEDNIVAIADGGYIEIGKTSDFQNQKKSYCSHKHYNCLKPMIISSLNGKIVNAYGFFYSDGYNSDSNIWDTIVTNTNDQFDLNTILHNNDAVIVDRGFRYCTTNEQNNGYKLILPTCLQPNQKQLTKDEANHSRKVTKIRWTVECIMHHIKIWKIFKSKYILCYGNNFIWNVLTIVCAMYNTFRSPIIKADKYDELNEDAINMIKMIEKSNENDINIIECKITQGWKKSTIETLKSLWFFPKFSIDDIRKWNCGPYQLVLALKYIKHSNDFSIWVNDKCPNTIKVKGVLSRYSRNDKQKKSRTIYIRFLPGVDVGLDDEILSWCTCYNGQRTVGGCAHVIAILYKILMVISNNNSISDHYYIDEHVNENYNTIPQLFQYVFDCATINNNTINVEDDDIVQELSDESTYDSDSEDSNNNEEEKNEIDNEQHQSEEDNDEQEHGMEKDKVGTKRKMKNQQIPKQKKRHT